MFRQTIVLVLAFLACGVSAQTTARKPEVYLPKNALSCERALAGNAAKNCRSCNQEATVGADSRITLQVGGCTSTPTELRAAQFTQTGIQFFKPLTATGLTTTGPNTLNGLTTIADLAVNAPITFPGFVVPRGTGVAPSINAAPRLAIAFGTAGLYFYYIPVPSSPPSDASFGASAVVCDADTYGSIAVNTASFGARPDLWICSFTALPLPAGAYAWQQI